MSADVIAKYPLPELVGKSICTIGPFFINELVFELTFCEKSSIAND